MKEIGSAGLRYKCDTEQGGVRPRNLQGKRRGLGRIGAGEFQVNQLLHVWKIRTKLA